MRHAVAKSRIWTSRAARVVSLSLVGVLALAVAGSERAQAAPERPSFSYAALKAKSQRQVGAGARAIQNSGIRNMNCPECAVLSGSQFEQLVAQSGGATPENLNSIFKAIGHPYQIQMPQMQAAPSGAQQQVNVFSISHPSADSRSGIQFPHLIESLWPQATMVPPVPAEVLELKVPQL